MTEPPQKNSRAVAAHGEPHSRASTGRKVPTPRPQRCLVNRSVDRASVLPYSIQRPEDETPLKSAAKTAAQIRSSALLSLGTRAHRKPLLLVVTAVARPTTTLDHMKPSPEGRRRIG